MSTQTQTTAPASAATPDKPKYKGKSGAANFA